MRLEMNAGYDKKLAALVLDPYDAAGSVAQHRQDLMHFDPHSQITMLRRCMSTGIGNDDTMLPQTVPCYRNKLAVVYAASRREVHTGC